MHVSLGCMHVSRGCMHVSRGCMHVSRGYMLVSRGCMLVSRGCMHVSRGYMLVSRGCMLVSRGCMHVSRGCMLACLCISTFRFTFGNINITICFTLSLKCQFSQLCQFCARMPVNSTHACHFVIDKKLQNSIYLSRKFSENKLCGTL